MLKTIQARMKQGFRTADFPKTAPTLPEKYMGRPECDSAKCAVNCRACMDVCPTRAINRENGTILIDMGKCIFCTDCTDACPTKAISFSSDYKMAAGARGNLIIGRTPFDLAEALDKKAKKLFGRSLKLRQVSAGGCNACEADMNVLGTVVFDIARFGIEFVASPRHADGMVVTGPVTKNMQLALEKTYKAIPAPKIVIASGACAISGGLFADHPESNAGVNGIIPVNLYIPGCPPNPYTVIDGLLRFLGTL